MLTQTETFCEAIRELEWRCERDRSGFELLAGHARHPGVIELLSWCARQRRAFVDELREVRTCGNRLFDPYDYDAHAGDSGASAHDEASDAYDEPWGSSLSEAGATLGDPIEAARRIEVSASIAYRSVLVSEMPEAARLLLMSHLYVIDRTRLILTRVQEGDVIVDAAGSVWTRSQKSRVA